MHSFGTRESHHVPEGVVTVKQVHGTDIFFAESSQHSSEPQGYDIVMTSEKNISVAVKTADCLPLLVVDPKNSLVAAVHAGWKGTLARVTQVAIQEFVKRGSRAEDLFVAMGPSMGAHCYEVEADVAGPFKKEFSWSEKILKRQSETKWLLDIPQANRIQLEELGVPSERIDHIDLCTHCHPNLFYSCRREGPATGRMVSFGQFF